MIDIDIAFGTLPATLRTELLDCYRSILRNFIESRWEPSELNGGKMCEVVYCILKGYIDSTYPSKATKPVNFVDACRALEQASASNSRSVRIQIPRVLIAVYEIRNNRGVGHIGGDVNPNHLDAYFVLSSVKWILAELVRLYHSISMAEAYATIESIIERTSPIVWEIDGQKRILNPKISKRNQTLLLLYHQPEGVLESNLLNWTEYVNASIYRNKILKVLHSERLVEYNEKNRTATISPRGIIYVEETLLEYS